VRQLGVLGLLLLMLASLGGGVRAAETPAATGTPPVAATSGLTMTAHPLLDGHVRSGSWFAIAVDVENTGPAIEGELRIAGGQGTRTRFAALVDLPTGSRKQYLLYAQPPSFGGNVTIELIADEQILAKGDVRTALHDPMQLVIGIVAENPARIVRELNLLPSADGRAGPAVVPLTLSSLPERVEAWASLDRLILQDVDTTVLSPGQVAALRGWVAAGGRLIVLGGTSGPATLAGLPDALLPFRPSATIEVEPESLRGLLGDLPDDAAVLPALAGDLARGRALAMSGDRVVAADTAFGSGTVTLLGFDPTTPWLAAADRIDAPMWRRLLPQRSTSGGMFLSDDSTLVGAVSNLPSLALPPIGGLIVLLFGYILLVGPVNYLVLRWLDRREWAWVTIPALIGVFAVGAFGFGAALRGSDLIVHEVAIVRGAAGTPDALAQSYLGVFSPSRSSYQLRAPGGALLASPISGDWSGGETGPLDVLQGDPSRIRNLSIGFGSLRTIRAESAAEAPVVESELRLENGRIQGTVRNASNRTLELPAIVLGGSVVVLQESLAPGATATVDLALVRDPRNQPQLSERIVGQTFFPGGGASFDEEAQRKLVRRSIIDQLSYDPFFGFSNQLTSDTPVLLAFGTDPVVPLELEGQQPRRVSNVLYHIPLPMTIRGETTFRSDLMRSSVLEADAAFFGKDAASLSFGPGTVAMSYHPISFEGAFRPTRVLLGMTWGGDISLPGRPPTVLEPIERCEPTEDVPCPVPPQDGLPEVEVRDRITGEWIPFPHFEQNQAYELGDAERWVDPSTGELAVRFVNDRVDGVNFGFAVELTGIVQ
jgi:hypothetical protein